MARNSRRWTSKHLPLKHSSWGATSHSSECMWMCQYKKSSTNQTAEKKHMGVSKNRDTPKWIIMENPIKMDDLGVPLFSETLIWTVLTTDVFSHAGSNFSSCLALHTAPTASGKWQAFDMGLSARCQRWCHPTSFWSAKVVHIQVLSCSSCQGWHAPSVSRLDSSANAPGMIFKQFPCCNLAAIAGYLQLCPLRKSQPCQSGSNKRIQKSQINLNKWRHFKLLGICMNLQDLLQTSGPAPGWSRSKKVKQEMGASQRVRKNTKQKLFLWMKTGNCIGKQSL